MGNIYYIGTFIRNYEKKRAITIPSVQTKMGYILETLKRNCEKVNLISVVGSFSKEHNIIPFKSEKYDNKEIDIQIPTIGSKFKILRGANYFIIYIYIFFCIITKVKKNDKVILYHSMMYDFPVLFLKRFMRFKLIFEIEEIYADVINKGKEKELENFQLADSYIFPTELLNEKINKENKPYTIIYGTYQLEKELNCKFSDGRIHCVYAGTFDSRKGGGLAAVAAKYLDNKYHIHIIGFGSENDKQLLQDQIKEISLITKCKLTFDGLFKGKEYIRFIQSCDIGLSTQSPDVAFNDTSFPSKVLSYMANGLRVVSIRIKALERSAINDLLFYYDENTPEAIAKAIKNVDLKKEYDCRARINELDMKFSEEVKKIII